MLVIDDEASLRMLMSDVLEESGYKVQSAPDGPSGLKILQSNARVDILVTDVGLPGGMNGRQAPTRRVCCGQIYVFYLSLATRRTPPSATGASNPACTC